MWSNRFYTPLPLWLLQVNSHLKRRARGPQQIKRVLLCDSQTLLGLFMCKFKTHSWLPSAPTGGCGSASRGLCVGSWVCLCGGCRMRPLAAGLVAPSMRQLPMCKSWYSFNLFLRTQRYMISILWNPVYILAQSVICLFTHRFPKICISSGIHVFQILYAFSASVIS